MHFGKITFDVDERGEVAMLTRNIKLQASADAEQSFYGGHVKAMVRSKMFVEGVEFNRMGQNMTLARYPIHWHLIGDAQGQYIKNASLHDTYDPRRRERQRRHGRHLQDSANLERLCVRG
jgi:cell migration-inducing and hyaluronan-binding protein